MLKKSLAALVAVSMVWLTGCAGGLAAGPPPGYYNPHFSPNAVTRVTARNMAMTDELFGLAFPGFYNTAYYGYGFSNPYAWRGYNWAYNSGRWHARRHRGDGWRVVVPAQPAEAPIVLGCYPVEVINETGEMVLVGNPRSKVRRFYMKAGQIVPACLLPTDRPYRLIHKEGHDYLEEIEWVHKDDTLYIR